MNESCGTSPIVGFRFTLSPMTDDFVGTIKGALKRTDLSGVWRHTDDVSTVIRGRVEHVFDVARTVLSLASEEGKHVSMSGTLSVVREIQREMRLSRHRANHQTVHQETSTCPRSSHCIRWVLTITWSLSMRKSSKQNRLVSITSRCIMHQASMGT